MTSAGSHASVAAARVRAAAGLVGVGRRHVPSLAHRALGAHAQLVGDGLLALAGAGEAGVYGGARHVYEFRAMMRSRQLMASCMAATAFWYSPLLVLVGLPI